MKGIWPEIWKEIKAYLHDLKEWRPFKAHFHVSYYLQKCNDHGPGHITIDVSSRLPIVRPSIEIIIDYLNKKYEDHTVVIQNIIRVNK